MNWSNKKVPTASDQVTINANVTVTIGPRKDAKNNLIKDAKKQTAGVLVNTLTLAGNAKVVVDKDAALNFVSTAVGPVPDVTKVSLAELTATSVSVQTARINSMPPMTPDALSDLGIGNGSSLTVNDGGIVRGAITSGDWTKLLPQNGSTLQNSMIYGDVTPQRMGGGKEASTISLVGLFTTFSVNAGLVAKPAPGTKTVDNLTDGNGVILQLTPPSGKEGLDYHDFTLVLGGKVNSGIDAEAVKGKVIFAKTADVVQKDGIASITGAALTSNGSITETGGKLTVTAKSFSNGGAVDISGKGTSFVVGGGEAGDRSFANEKGATIKVTAGATATIKDYTDLKNNGKITVDSATATFDSKLVGTGTVDVGGDAVLTFNKGVGAATTIHFASEKGRIVVGKDGVAAFSPKLTGAVTGDSIRLDGVKPDQVETKITFFDKLATVTVTGADGKTITTFTISADNPIKIKKTGEHDDTDTVITIGCLVAGTRVLTPDGEVAVEALAIGGRVLTASGASRPIVWLGHCSIDTTKHPRPSAVWPVLVRAGAFAEGRPSADLWLSPGHNVVVDGVLMPIVALVNGRTVVQVRRPTVEYWHVELDAHDIVLAQGLAAESYLDTGNRGAFENGGAFVIEHPDLGPKHWADTCLPLVLEGPRIGAARAALFERAAEMGHVMTTDHDLHVVADGKRIEAVVLGDRRFIFLLPACCAESALRSRAFVPAQMELDSHDDRRLGVFVQRIQLDGADVPLDDPAFAAGWHKLEGDADTGLRRWTDGTTPLPAGTRLVLVDLAHGGRYWADRPDDVAVLFG
ncbi:MAG TPA: Hint domain-containing protein [Acidisphaera sp.]|nr:Hint domain-containing protein [Acidisphaera sp.]